MNRFYDVIPSPVGSLLTTVEEDGTLIGITFLTGRESDAALAGTVGTSRDPERAAAIRAQLREYFAGERRIFDLPLDPAGTAFQKSVWRELREIPFGKTRSYGEIARAIGRPGAARAVGRAAGANPIPIVIPCHRCVGADGSLTGFAGGLEIKRRLLELEGVRL